MKRRKKFLAFACAKGRRLPVDENGPVRVARRHSSIVAGIRASLPSAALTSARLEPLEVALVRNHLAREDVNIEGYDFKARFADFDVVPSRSKR